MKYLKLFESLTKGYEEIQLRNRQQYSSVTYEKISDREISDIFDVMNDLNIEITWHRDNISDELEPLDKPYMDINYLKRTDRMSIEMKLYISKTDDDWWYINIGRNMLGDPHCKYYKCDQWDGLINCLKDIL